MYKQKLLPQRINYQYLIQLEKLGLPIFISNISIEELDMCLKIIPKSFYTETFRDKKSRLLRFKILIYKNENLTTLASYPNQKNGKIKIIFKACEKERTLVPTKSFAPILVFQ